MLKQLNTVINRTGPEGNGEQLGRGQRKKYRRILSESSSSEEYESVNKQVAARTINRIRARSFLQQYNQEKESNREAVTSRNRDSEFNVQILAELREIKSVLLETLTLLKNGCTPLMTAPIPNTLGTPPGPTSDLIPCSSESSAVIPAQSSSLQTLYVKESRSNGNCKKVRIGSNTSISAEQFAHVKWTDHKKATKDLLMAVFGRGILATHCYSGRCSNAFKNKAAKPQLDSEKVSDIINLMEESEEQKHHHGKTSENTRSQTERVSLLKRRNKKSFTCTQCGKSLSTSFTLSVHMRIHTGEKPFTCDQCEKSFADLGSLKNHENIHTREKLHPCDQCEKTFVRASHLKNHLKVHSKEKPHSCSLCGESFSHLHSLKVHQKIHTGVREYMCFECEKTFITAEDLKHQRIHTVSLKHLRHKHTKNIQSRSSSDPAQVNNFINPTSDN